MNWFESIVLSMLMCASAFCFAVTVGLLVATFGWLAFGIAVGVIGLTAVCLHESLQ